MSPNRSSSLTPWLVGTLVLLALGAVIFFKNLPATPKPSPLLSPTDVPPALALNFTPLPGDVPAGALEPGSLPNRLRINLDAYPLVLDPQRALLPKEIAHVSLTYQGLTRLDERLEAVPAAAETWTYDPDGMGLTFTLRHNLRYSDGSPLNALRFAYALQRAIDPQTASGYAWLLDPLVGARQWRLADAAAPGYQRQNFLSSLGIHALDAAGGSCNSYDQPECLTLRLEFTKPAPYFHFVSGLWLAYPVKEELVSAKGEGWWNSAANRVGNGPFILQELEPFVHALFTPNPYYAGEQPRLREIEFYYISDTQAALRAYLNNQLDIIASNAELLPAIQASKDLSQEHLVYQGACSSVVRFNWKGAHAPVEMQATRQENILPAENVSTQTITTTQVIASAFFSELALRQAFALAFDAQAWSLEIDDSFSIPSWTWIPPGFPGYDPGYQPYAYAPEKARQALAASSYGGTEAIQGLQLVFLDTPYNRRRYSWLAENYRTNLGINLALEPLDEAAFAQRETEKEEFPLINRQTWCAPYPDPYAWLSAYWLDEFSLAPGQAYQLPGFAELINAADVTLDTKQRLALYSQALRLLLDSAPGALGTVSMNHYLVKPWVKGITTSPYDSVWPGGQFPERIYLAR